MAGRMQPASMSSAFPGAVSKRPLYALYALLAAVTGFSLLHAAAGSISFVRDLLHKNAAVELPFGTKAGTAVVSSAPEKTKRAGLRIGDTVLRLDGQPYRGYQQLIAWTHVAHPGDTLLVTVRRQGEPAGSGTEALRVPGTGYGQKPAWAWAVETVFFVIPLLSLLTGLYVLAARPLSLHAWLVFFILSYCATVFFPGQFMPVSLVPLAAVWSDVVQTLLPIALLLFGITFPDRAPIDRRYPWLKYLLIVPQLIFFPTDLLFSLGGLYDLRVAGPLVRWNAVTNVVEQIFSVLSICSFFALLGYRMGTTTGDARRRLRLLYIGATVGMTPLFILLLVQVVRKGEFGAGVPRPVFLVSVAMLLILPATLAYVVVVQRAMELRILIRQGTKYFFAKQSVVVVRVALTVWLGWSLTKFSLHPERRRAVDIVWTAGVIGIFAVYRLLLGGRLQQWIDRRFFRDAYSAEQVLSDLSDEARTFTEVEPLLTTITQRIGATLHIERIAIFLRSGDQYQLQFATGGVPMLLGETALALHAGSTTIDTLSREKAPSVVYRDDPQSWLVDATDAERSALNDISAELLVPLPGRNRLLGVMTLGPKRSEEPYSRTDRQLLQSVASQTGLALENAELLENLTVEITQRERISSEIDIARDVQQRLFPQSYPVVPGVDMAGHCRPAHAVGGDYYDLFVTEDVAAEGGRLALAVGDISGKGISASLLMASLRASLRSLARMDTAPGDRDLTRLMRQVNQLVYESSAANRYATFFFAELDPRTRVLTYVNAGHNPPFVLRGPETIALSPTGLVVGLLEDAIFEQGTIQLEPGDVLLAYTDGISEAMNAVEEEWGEEGMLAAAAKLIGEPGCGWSAGSLVECLFREADRFTAGAPQHDDMTVVVCAVG